MLLMKKCPKCLGLGKMLVEVKPRLEMHECDACTGHGRVEVRHAEIIIIGDKEASLAAAKVTKKYSKAVMRLSER